MLLWYNTANVLTEMLEVEGLITLAITVTKYAPS